MEREGEMRLPRTVMWLTQASALALALSCTGPSASPTAVPISPTPLVSEPVVTPVNVPVLIKQVKESMAAAKSYRLTGTVEIDSLEGSSRGVLNGVWAGPDQFHVTARGVRLDIPDSYQETIKVGQQVFNRESESGAWELLGDGRVETAAVFSLYAGTLESVSWDIVPGDSAQPAGAGQPIALRGDTERKMTSADGSSESRVLIEYTLLVDPATHLIKELAGRNKSESRGADGAWSTLPTSSWRYQFFDYDEPVAIAVPTDLSTPTAKPVFPGANN